jgi:diguanylate cyclase (GGDEF)-like protein
VDQGGSLPSDFSDLGSANLSDGHLSDENALLRASLAEMRGRIDELEEHNDRDTVTPLANRRRFLRELERVVGVAERHGTLAAMLCIGLDDLAGINSRHGRFAADAALIHAAKTISRLIRSTDLLARVGDDEFGLILDHLDHNSAIETAERLACCIAGTPLDLGGSTIAVSASIGIATIMAGDTADDVIGRAARNMALARSGE